VILSAAASEVIGLLFPAVLLAGAVNDLRRYEIPNWLPALLAAGFVVLAVGTGMAWSDIAWSFAVAALTLAAGFVLFILRALGGGDTKLMAAAALWTGSDQILVFVLATAIFGGAMALCLLVYRRLPVPSALSRNAILKRLHDADGPIPYAVPIAAAGLLVYPKLPVLGA
jgi:prepilin peptidase CpaA